MKIKRIANKEWAIIEAKEPNKFTWIVFWCVKKLHHKPEQIDSKRSIKRL